MMILNNVAGLLLSIAVNGDGQTVKVNTLSENQVEAQGLQISQWKDFDSLLEAPIQGAEMTLGIPTLQPPVPKKNLAILGMGMAYSDHAEEVKMEDTVFFRKNSQPTLLTKPLPNHLQYMDYEVEVSLLMHRDTNEIFGYLMHNDLTDREIQVMEIDEKNPEPSFSKAKSFPGANGVSAVLRVGSDLLWDSLHTDLYYNGELTQSLATRDNVMNPKHIHQKVFSNPNLHQGKDWVLIGTGTVAGTIFQAPTFLQRIGVFLRSGFSMKRAKKRWLNRFEYVKPGDHFQFKSPLLGNYSTYVPRRARGK